MLVNAESLAAAIARQQGDALQTVSRFPDEWNNGVSRVRGSSDIPGVINTERNTVLAAGQDT